MQRSIFIFTCALAAAACGGSDHKTAQDPSMTMVTSAPTDPNLSAQPTSPSPTDTPMPSSDTGSSPQSMNDTAALPATGTAGSSMSNTNTQSGSPMPATYENPGSANGTMNADNTKVNDRDRHGAATPMDQGNGKSDTQITASIRKAVVGSKTLSFTAKNVKIITNGSKVTLRGPVKDEQEKSTIETFARQTAGVSSIDDQLEIKK